MRPTLRRTVALATFPALIGPLAACAQSAPAGPSLGPATRCGEPRLTGGLNVVIGQPLGAFRSYVANGYGLGGHALARLGGSGAFALRLDGGFLNYGSETLRLPLSTATGGGRVGLEVTTSNNVFWAGAGPQVMVPRGLVRPYVNGTAGFSYFSTTSSVPGRRTGSEPFAEETNYDDAQFSWGGGGGVLVPVVRNARWRSSTSACSTTTTAAACATCARAASTTSRPAPSPST